MGSEWAASRQGAIKRWANVLIFVGVIAAGASGLLVSRVYTAQRAAAQPQVALDRVASAAQARRTPDTHGAPQSGSGFIRIPELSLSAPITNGIGAIDLVEGVGHIPGSAVAGGLGTMGLAGHRDTFFRALQRTRVGMEIFVTGDGGTYRYRVDRIDVVDPSRVDVLFTQQEPKLVLVTCYPFTYVGAAPQRFVVTAHLISLLPGP